MSNDIFPPNLIIKSLRDSGYKNTAYALAELVDNSVQAKAKKIEIYLCESTQKNGRRSLSNIIVVDNGEGMNEDELIKAVRFGDGTRLKKKDWTGIGRFGMGLPSASISQCSKVEVWSRKAGAESILYTYLDIAEVESGKLKEIPKPKAKALPDFMPKSDLLKKSGTIIMWSDLDKCTWKTAKALHANSAFLLGRIYRYFIDNKSVDIRFKHYDLDELKLLKQDKTTEELVKNDPLFLMSGTQCPEPYDDKPMFEEWKGSAGTKEYEIKVDDRVGKVRLRFTIAKKEVRTEGVVNAGSQDFGKIAKNNIGISIVRADRELELDQSFVIGYNPKERWWGCEVSFDPILDEVFGVTNNKQHARHFSEMVNHRYVDLIDTHESVEKVEQELKRNNDPSWVLFRVCHDIKNALGQIRREIENQTKGKRSLEKKQQTAPIEPSVKILNSGTTDRVDETGKQGVTDRNAALSPSVQQDAIAKLLENKGIDKSTAVEMAKNLVASGTRYDFEEADIQNAVFFDVGQGGSVNIVTINTSHPFYKLLYNQIASNEVDVDSLDEDELRRRISLASVALKILIGSWARLEDEASDQLRVRLQDIRHEWGKMARDFLSKIQSEE